MAVEENCSHILPRKVSESWRAFGARAMALGSLARVHHDGVVAVARTASGSKNMVDRIYRVVSVCSVQFLMQHIRKT